MKERRISQLTLHVGSCVDLLKLYPDNYFDSVVTDPPYDLTANKKGGSGEASVNLDTPYGRARITTGFMGQKWDGTGIAFKPSTWAEVLRVLKPGGHVLAFGGTRTYHRMVCAIEDAGFEIRDFITWHYSEGFPKSRNVSKDIDKAAGAEREMVRHKARPATSGTMSGATDTRPWIERSRELGYHEVPGDNPVTEAAKEWQGWGTALKPSTEPICVGRKPIEGTIANNVLTHRTGAINIDGCRLQGGRGEEQVQGAYDGESTVNIAGSPAAGKVYAADLGRWPANTVHDGSDAVVACFPDAPGQQAPVSYGVERRKTQNVYGEMRRGNPTSQAQMYVDQGSAARFYYCAKTSNADRHDGLDAHEVITIEWCSINEEQAWGNEARKVRLRVDTAVSPPKVIGVYGTSIRSVSEWSTMLFGSEQTAPCLSASTSIIATKTSSTTSSRILSFFQSSITNASTRDASFETESGGSLAASAEIGSLLLTTTNDKMASALAVEPAASPLLLQISAFVGASDHPTVKPVELMRWLVRLVTPKQGRVLDPFMGSGSTGKACMFEGFRFVGMDLTPEYEPIARARILWALREKHNRDPFGFGGV